jgi:hypothetical protein
MNDKLMPYPPGDRPHIEMVCRPTASDPLAQMENPYIDYSFYRVQIRALETIIDDLRYQLEDKPHDQD